MPLVHSEDIVKVEEAGTDVHGRGFIVTVPIVSASPPSPPIFAPVSARTSQALTSLV
jgi:hypothetical protein